MAMSEHIGERPDDLSAASAIFPASPFQFEVAV
jgi:hypothetical protein